MIMNRFDAIYKKTKGFEFILRNHHNVFLELIDSIEVKDNFIQCSIEDTQSSWKLVCKIDLIEYNGQYSTSFISYDSSIEYTEKKIIWEENFTISKQVFLALQQKMKKEQDKYKSVLVVLTKVYPKNEIFVHYTDLQQIAELYGKYDFDYNSTTTYQKLQSAFIEEFSDFGVQIYGDNYDQFFYDFRKSNEDLIRKSLSVVPSRLFEPSINYFVEDFLDDNKLEDYVEQSLNSVQGTSNLYQLEYDLKKIENAICDEFTILFEMETALLVKYHELHAKSYDYDSDLISDVLQQQIRKAVMSWLSTDYSK